MANYIKRGNKWQYEISYKDQNGKYKKIRKSGYRTKAEAKEAATDIEYNIKRGFQADKKEILLSDYFEQWIDLYKKDKVSTSTYKKYIASLNVVKKNLPFEFLQSITRSKYQAFLNKYAKKHAKASVSKLNIHIRACVRNAIDDHIIYTDFTKNAVLAGLDGKPENEKFIGLNESMQLLKEAEKDLFAGYPSKYLIILALTSGLRFSELLGLTWDDFDFQNRTLNVSKTWDYKFTHDFDSTKNEQSVRKVAIDKNTIEIFEKYKNEQEVLFNKLSISNKKGLIFIYYKDEKVISSNAANNMLRKLCKEVNITTPITIHGLRHTHASLLLFKGISILSVSKRLGHKNISVTQNTYAHVVKEMEEREQEKTLNVLNSLF